MDEGSSVSALVWGTGNVLEATGIGIEEDWEFWGVGSVCCEAVPDEAGGEAGGKTPQRNPTSRPLLHSCLNAINSQNSSRVFTLFHFPGLFPFWGLSFSFPGSVGGVGDVSSSSSSSTKRDLGSSGKRGMRQRSGMLGLGEREWRGSREGCQVGAWRRETGKKERVSWMSQEGTRR